MVRLQSVGVASAVATDGAGNAFVTGFSSSTNWLSGGFDVSPNGGWDAFVLKFSPTGTPLWGTYLGGTQNDRGWDIAVSHSGSIAVAGDTASAGWITGGYGTTYNGDTDGFVALIIGRVLADVGLRAHDGTSIIRIACEAPSAGGQVASPLRIHKNGTTYGILMVETNAPDASRILQQTATGVKAWKKLP
jgi:hypothetical protein